MACSKTRLNLAILTKYVDFFSCTDYALHFPKHGVTDYANIWGMRSLTQFTVCLWMKASSRNDGTVFSYSVPGEYNELLIYDHTDFELCIGDDCR